MRPLPARVQKGVGGAPPFAEWFFPLHATVGLDAAEPPEEALEKLAGLRFYKHVHTEDGAMAEFFTRLDALVCPVEARRLLGLSRRVDGMRGAMAIGGSFSRRCWHPSACRRWLVDTSCSGRRGERHRARHSFMRPPGEFLMGVGILPAVAPQFLPEVLPRMTAASQASTMMGGKRYLSGWIDFDHAAWKAHYGEKWPAVVEAKRKFDPHGILNPGFIKYE